MQMSLKTNPINKELSQDELAKQIGVTWIMIPKENISHR